MGTLAPAFGYSVGNFLARSLNFLAFLYVARQLGVHAFGILEFCTVLLTYFLLLADGGLEAWATREVARGADVKALAGRVVLLRVLLSVAAFGVLLALLPLLPNEPYVRPVMLLLGLCMFAEALTLTWVFLGQQKMRVVTVALTLAQVVFAALVLMLARAPEHVLWIPVFRLLGDLAMAGFLLFRFHREHGLRHVRPTLRGALQITPPALSMGMSQAMVLINYHFDSVLLGFLRGLQVVGWYGVAYRLVNMILALPLAYFTGLLPLVSGAYETDRDTFLRLTQRSLRMCVVFAAPLGVGGAVLSGPIIAWLFGPLYADSVLPAQVLIWSAVIIIITGTLRQGLYAIGRQGLDLKAAMASAICNVALNLALIPEFGMLGAAGATVAAELLWMVMVWWYLRRSGFAINPIPPLINPVVAGGGMAVVLLLTPDFAWPVRGFAGVAAYCFVLLMLREEVIRSWRDRGTTQPTQR